MLGTELLSAALSGGDDLGRQMAGTWEVLLPAIVQPDSLNYYREFLARQAARQALEEGGGAPTVLNAANEVAVAAFIAGQIKFGSIARLVEATINDWIRAGNLAPLSSADDAIAVDHKARNRAASLLPQIALKAS